MVWKRARPRSRARVGKGAFNKVFGRHALHHEFSSGIKLDAESTTADTTIIPLLACDKTLGNPDSIYVNPRNSNKTNSNDHLTYGSSVVKKIHYNIKLAMDPAITDADVYALRAYCMPITIRYDDLDKEAIGETIGTYIPVVEHTSDEKIVPNWSGTDLVGQLSDCWDGDGLTTDSKWESVAFDPQAFETALGEKPISPLLRKVTSGGLRGFDIRKEFPVSMSGTIQVPKKVQLQTEHTFYGLLVGLYQTSSSNQYYYAGDVTAGEHLYMNMSYSFFEWNKEFNQNVS